MSLSSHPRAADPSPDAAERDTLLDQLVEAIGYTQAEVASTGNMAPPQVLLDAIAALRTDRAALARELGLAKLRADAAESTRDVAITRAERLEARNKELEAEPTILLAELALAHGRIQRQERTLIEAEAQVAALTREAAAAQLAIAALSKNTPRIEELLSVPSPDSRAPAPEVTNGNV